MLLTMTGKHVEITDAMRAHVQEKVEKLPRYFDGLSQVEVLIDGSEGGRPCGQAGRLEPGAQVTN